MIEFILKLLIRVYQIFFSPLLVTLFGSGCRHSPSCSFYTYQAIEKHGARQGLLMGIKRILQCNPYVSEYTPWK